MQSQGSQMRKWIVPTAGLFTVGVVLFLVFYVLDVVKTGGEASDPAAAGMRFFFFDPSCINNALPQLAGIIAAVLAIVITVVSIVVQLSADRYTGVAQMFFQDRANVTVVGYYIVACIQAILVSMAVRSDFVPRVAVVASIFMTGLGLVIMAPYFAYVFWFLEPTNIINRIRSQAVHTVTRGITSSDPARCSAAQAAALTAMEELTDITSNSISGKDKIIASGAVDALRDLTLAYLEIKPTAAPSWFEIGPDIRGNPDFVAMDPESLQDLVTRRTWTEWKVMRQYLGIYNEALTSMKDINYLIAIDTRYLGEAAGKAKDEELMRLVLRFMNSYMRSTLNAKEVRTAYNVLNQYRLLVEALIRQGNGAMALEGVKHIIFYGHVSFDMKLTFVTETAAYDLSALCQTAHEHRAPEERAMLAEFLELDQPLQVRSQEKGLLGVRKAQVKLAAYYLSQGEEEKARLICQDMKEEPPERVAQIRGQLEHVVSKDFWEIIDRGRNFEYMPEKQRECLKTFFSWLETARRDELRD
jgi:hypothetical protein